MTPAIPYGRQSISAGDIAAVDDVLNSAWLTTGPAVDAFEEALEQRTGHPTVSVTSGTAALHVAYSALGVGPGHTVITTPLTFVATASAAALLGAKVRFADVDPGTGLVDPESVQALVDSSTRVVAAVDYAGVPADYVALREMLPASVYLLADAAHSIGAARDGVVVGDMADISTFSFFPTKNLTTAEGGAVVVKDRAVLPAVRAFKNHGLVRDRTRMRFPDEGPWHQEVHAFGLNYRLPDVLAALGLSQLARLDHFISRRTEIAERYLEALGSVEDIQLPVVPPGAEPAWHLFPVRVPPARREAIFTFMRARGVLVQVNYIPAYWHPVFADLGYRRGACPAAEDYYAGEISLPIFVDLAAEDQEYVIDVFLDALARA